MPSRTPTLAILAFVSLGVSTIAGFAGRIVNQPLEESLPRFREIWSEHARAGYDLVFSPHIARLDQGLQAVRGEAGTVLHG